MPAHPMPYPLRDSYCIKAWLSGEAVAYLDSAYPDDESGVALSKLVRREMLKASRHAPPAAARALQRPEKPQPQQFLKLVQKPSANESSESKIETEGKTKMPSNEQVRPKRGEIGDNPIGTLQVLCQQNKAALPTYTISSLAGGFVCECAAQVLGVSVMGKSAPAATKKAAKKAAAIAALKKLGFS